jgi:hypothetical protein
VVWKWVRHGVYCLHRQLCSVPSQYNRLSTSRQGRQLNAPGDKVLVSRCDKSVTMVTARCSVRRKAPVICLAMKSSCICHQSCRHSRSNTNSYVWRNVMVIHSVQWRSIDVTSKRRWWSSCWVNVWGSFSFRRVEVNLFHSLSLLSILHDFL